MERIAIAADDGTGAKGRPLHSERLTRNLTAHRTVAMHAELMGRVDIALAVLAHSLVASVFRQHNFSEPIAHVSIGQPVLPEEVQSSAAWMAVQARREQLHANLPKAGDNQSLFAWLLQQPQAVVLDLLAFCTGCSLDVVQVRETGSPAFAEIAQAVDLNMATWWQPTAENYLAHVSKVRVIDVVTQAVSPEAAQPLMCMKKDVLAAEAERLLAGSGWLPTVFVES